MARTEPGGGSDQRAMTTIARKDADGDGCVADGAKTWITDSRRSRLIALRVEPDPAAEPRHRGISILLVEHGPIGEGPDELQRDVIVRELVQCGGIDPR
jgi:alkylation response protein AidB-like acyl-CoA dehydrogenase